MPYLSRIQTFYALVCGLWMCWRLYRLKSQALIFTESSFERWWHLCHCRSQGDAGSGLSMVMGGALGNLMVHPEAPVPKLLSMGAGRGSVQHLAGPCFPPEAEGAAGGGGPERRASFLSPFCFFFSLLFSVFRIVGLNFGRFSKGIVLWLRLSLPCC